ncbi:MAG: ankyrin repeat domain-containing protein [Blastocatellia bacterium]|nr:ankyrin repeat domain-containing protein [Blastocatellia bacterium]
MSRLISGLKRGAVFFLCFGLGWGLAHPDFIGEQRDQLFVTAAGEGNIFELRVLRLLGADTNCIAFGTQPLVEAGTNGQTEVVRYLLEKGASLEQKNKFCATALERAAYAGHRETVVLLISKGANVNATSLDGSVLEAAREGHHPEIVALLKQHGAN